jgi:hypothetical protein
MSAILQDRLRHVLFCCYDTAILGTLPPSYTHAATQLRHLFLSGICSNYLIGGFSCLVYMNFSAAHALKGYQGDCARIHGHNWIIEVFVKCHELDEIGKKINSEQARVSKVKVCETPGAGAFYWEE